MPAVHRVDDTDSDGDSATVGSPTVFANGGETIGGALGSALGLDDTLGISDEEARSILSGIAAELAAGNDPYLNEPLEEFTNVNPNTGQEGAAVEPGSDAATGVDALLDDDIEKPTSKWIIVSKGVNNKVLPEVWTKLENFAISLGRPITMNSGYRAPSYNAKLKGAASKSLHMRRMAADIAWGTTNLQSKVDMIQKAIDAGFTGIGCYNSFIHVDIGLKRNWGPGNSSKYQFEEFKPVLKANGYTGIGWK